MAGRLEGIWLRLGRDTRLEQTTAQCRDRKRAPARDTPVLTRSRSCRPGASHHRVALHDTASPSELRPRLPESLLRERARAARQELVSTRSRAHYCLRRCCLESAGIKSLRRKTFRGCVRAGLVVAAASRNAQQDSVLSRDAACAETVCGPILPTVLAVLGVLQWARRGAIGGSGLRCDTDLRRGGRGQRSRPCRCRRPPISVPLAAPRASTAWWRETAGNTPTRCMPGSEEPPAGSRPPGRAWPRPTP